MTRMTASPAPDWQPMILTRPRPSLPRGAVRAITMAPHHLLARLQPDDAVAVQGVLPLGGPTAAPTSGHSRHQRVPRSRSTPHLTHDDTVRIATKVCRGAVEVVYGNRAVTQLLRCTNDRVYREITRTRARQRSRRASTTSGVVHARLEHLDTQQPGPKSIEAFARVRQGDRVRALAARLEFSRGRWICVALDLDRLP